MNKPLTNNPAPDAEFISPVLSLLDLAALLRISPATIPSMRSRNPEKLPVPFLSRPLRWRREAVLRWMEQREREEQERIDREFSIPLRRSRQA